MLTLPNQPSTITHILKCAWDAILEIWHKVFLLAILASLFTLLPLYSIQIFDGVFFKLNEFVAPLLLIFFIAWLLALIVMLSLIFQIYTLLHRLNISTKQSLKQAIYRLIPTCLVILLYGIVVLSGTMLLIIPGVILAVSLLLCILLSVIENQGVFQSLIQSHKYVWGHWWHTFLTITTPILIGVACQFGVYILMVGIVSNLPISFSTFYFLYFVAHTLVQALMLIGVFTVTIVLYHDLRLRYITQQFPTQPRVGINNE